MKSSQQLYKYSPTRQYSKCCIIRDSTKFERAGTYYFSSAPAAQSSRNTHRVLGGQGAPAIFQSQTDRKSTKIGTQRNVKRRVRGHPWTTQNSNCSTPKKHRSKVPEFEPYASRIARRSHARVRERPLQSAVGLALSLVLALALALA